MIKTTIADLYDRCVQFYRDSVAITDGPRSFTYAQIGSNAGRLTAALQGLGFGKGERVAFLMANCAEYIFCEYAVARAGGTRVPLAVLLGSDDHIYMMNSTRCKLLIYHANYAERVRAMAPQLEFVEHYICVGGAAEAIDNGHLHLQALLDQSSAAPRPVAVDSEDIAGIYFTGGTTGRPKGVMLSHRAWIYTYLSEMLEFGLGSHEVFVFATPLTHAAGCFILPVLLRGGRCVVLNHFEPEQLLATIARERATATLLVPTMIYLLLEYPETERHDLSSLKNVLYGASPIAPERLKQAIEKFGPIFTQFYGQTEAPMALSALRREDHCGADAERQQRVLSSAGRLTLHAELRLLDDSGNEVAPGESGEIVMRAANMMSGYFDNPEATAATIRDGWLYTGDIGRCDQDGFIHIVDRKKDMIISGGFNIYPREIEDVLFEYPGVSKAVVIGVPHAKWGEEVKALVVRDAGAAQLDAQALIQYVKAKKGSLMAPKSVEFVDTIPLTNLGKVDKKLLRDRYR